MALHSQSGGLVSKNIFLEALGLPNDAVSTKIFEAFDMDKDGKLSFLEFANGMVSLHAEASQWKKLQCKHQQLSVILVVAQRMTSNIDSSQLNEILEISTSSITSANDILFETSQIFKGVSGKLYYRIPYFIESGRSEISKKIETHIDATQVSLPGGPLSNFLFSKRETSLSMKKFPIFQAGKCIIRNPQVTFWAYLLIILNISMFLIGMNYFPSI